VTDSTSCGVERSCGRLRGPRGRPDRQGRAADSDRSAPVPARMPHRAQSVQQATHDWMRMHAGSNWLRASVCDRSATLHSTTVPYGRKSRPPIVNNDITASISCSQCLDSRTDPPVDHPHGPCGPQASVTTIRSSLQTRSCYPVTWHDTGGNCRSGQ